MQGSQQELTFSMIPDLACQNGKRTPSHVGQAMAGQGCGQSKGSTEKQLVSVHSLPENRILKRQLRKTPSTKPTTLRHPVRKISEGVNLIHTAQGWQFL